MPIIIKRTASEFTATIELDHTKTVVDLSKMDHTELGDFGFAIANWRANNYRGYPDFQK